MAGLMSADEVFKKAEDAAAAATSPDEKSLQIDYQALKEKFRAALGDRKVALCHINKFLPEGYEDQGRFNLVLLTAGNVVFDMVIGDSYFRYDMVSLETHTQTSAIHQAIPEALDRGIDVADFPGLSRSDHSAPRTTHH